MSDADSVAGLPAAGYVRLPGELDVATVPLVEIAALNAARTAEHVVTLDVGDVTLIDSAGLGLLADVLAIGTARGCAVVLRGASADLHRLLLNCGMETLFTYR